MDLMPISQREIPVEEVKIGENQGYLPGETGRRPSKKKREKIGGMPGLTKIGRNRETTWVFESSHCKPIGRNRETV